MALIELKLNLKQVIEQLTRIADALERRYPPKRVRQSLESPVALPPSASDAQTYEFELEDQIQWAKEHAEEIFADLRKLNEDEKPKEKSK